MARSLSASAKRKMNATGGEAPVLLLEIDHPDLPGPVRVVKDNEDLTSTGNLFVAMAFDITPPDDLSTGLPRATLRVDNIGRELTQWLNVSGGGKGATARMMYVMRDAPDLIEWETTLELSNVTQTPASVDGQLGYTDILNLPGTVQTYRPETAPGLF